MKYHFLMILAIFILPDLTLLRANPILVHQETFDDCSSVSWTAVDISDNTDVWNCNSDGAGGNYYQINGYGGSTDEDWLISPPINLNAQTNEYLTFQYFDIYNGNDIELKYSTDYDGSGSTAGISNATWTSIPLDLLLDISTDFNCTSNFLHYPAIDISGISGDAVYFAFHYTSSAPLSAEWVRIDEIKIEADYYAGIEAEIAGGTSCASLKTALHSLIRGHNVIPYTDTDFDTWDALIHTDNRWNDAGTTRIVWDMLSDNPNGSEAYEYNHCDNRDTGGGGSGEGIAYNREHAFPKSWWGGGTTFPQDTQNFDVHQLTPADKYMNTQKSNYPPGIVTTPSFTGSNGTKVGDGNLSSCSIDYFEPIDEYKGDWARMYFYVATRYESQITGWAPSTTTTVDDCALADDSHLVFEPWLLSLLIDWHNGDPVSTKEINRNNAVYSIQGNRNPFIDHPEYVGLIWGDNTSTCSELSNPLPPAEVVNVQAEVLTATSARITWDAVPGALKYQVKFKELNESNWTITGIFTNEKTLAGLTPNRHYECRVRVETAAGWSLYSNLVRFYTSTCGIPENIAFSQYPNGDYKIEWSHVIDAEKYQIRYRELGTSTWLISGSTPGNNFKRMNFLSPNTTYEFRVRAFCINGFWSRFSLIINYTTGPALRLAPDMVDKGISIFPNPAQDAISFAFEQKQPSEVSIRIHDTFGRLVAESIHQFRQGQQQGNIDISNLPSGQYFLTTITDGKVSDTVKFIKN